jgi:hypothetical protein
VTDVSAVPDPSLAETPGRSGEAVGRRTRQPLLPTIAAWAIWLVALLGGAIGLALAFDAASRPGGFQQDPITGVASLVVIVAYGVVGLICRIRRPDHNMGWLFLAITLAAAASALTWGLMAQTSEPGSGMGQPWHVTLLVSSAVIIPAWTVLLALLILIFPDGRPATIRERRLVWAILAGAPALAVGMLLRPGPVIGAFAIDNPLVGPGPLGTFGSVLFAAAFVWAMGAAALGIRAMARRYREGGPVLRHQIRWFAFGAGLILFTSVGFIATSMLVPPDPPAIGTITYLVWSLSLTVLPVAVLFAITRHRLYEIDRILSRTFVYGALTAILAGLLAASMRFLEAVFVAVTGQDSDLVVVLSVLLLTTTFTPIKNRLEKVTSGWFAEKADPAAPGATVVSTGPLDLADLDARIEAIARRVSKEVVAGAHERGDR